MEPKDDDGKAEKTFGTFGKKVDQFMTELHEASDKLEHEFRNKYEELKQSAEKAKQEANSNERWKEVESALRKAGDELANAFRAAFSKRDKNA